MDSYLEQTITSLAKNRNFMQSCRVVLTFVEDDETLLFLCGSLGKPAYLLLIFLSV